MDNVVKNDKKRNFSSFSAVENVVTKSKNKGRYPTITDRIVPPDIVQLNIQSEIGVAAAIEARRLAEKYGKDYFNCEDLMQIMGVGMNNIRQLMCSEGFPTIEIGNRKVVSSVAFALWSLNKSNN